ncbi:MAG: glycosyltransferase [Planctomycetes bacterium]|nr:glycosyltransferase [Planctomycetota bacterium]MBL7143370.1 glycosyltransferase [Phycisphaerae bacterium]
MIKKKVLIIAYHYPPANNGGIERPYRFAKYLPQYGYDPIVITTDAYGQIEGEKDVFRFRDIVGQNVKKTSGILFFLLRALRKIVVMIGLFSYGWYFTAKKNIENIVLNNKIDIVFSTYPPITTVLLGLHLKRKYNIPLVVDFRDGFLFERCRKLNFVQEYCAKIIEKEIVKHADFIITVSPPITNYFKQRYKVRDLATIYNGFDTSDLDDIKDIDTPELEERPFLMKYFGRFSKSSENRKPANLFKALSILKEEGLISKDSFHLVMFTDLSESESSLIKKLKIENIVTVNTIINRDDALREMKVCDFLLFHGDVGSSSVVSTKLLEYIFMETPILGICKNNEAEHVIEKTNTGIVTGFEVDEIIDGLKKALNYNSRDFKPNYDEINKFTRKKITRELANVFTCIKQNAQTSKIFD